LDLQFPHNTDGLRFSTPEYQQLASPVRRSRRFALTGDFCDLHFLPGEQPAGSENKRQQVLRVGATCQNQALRISEPRT